MLRCQARARTAEGSGTCRCAGCPGDVLDLVFLVLILPKVSQGDVPPELNAVQGGKAFILLESLINE